jgi:uncharacterized spore protein YtfJ
MENLTQQVDTLFSNMENFSQNDSLIGKPTTQGDKTFLPVMSLTLGYGGGDTQSKGKQSNAASSAGTMGSGALGVGAKLCTDAVIVIDKDNVLLAPINATSSVGQIISQIPQIIGNMQSGGSQPAQPGSSPFSQPGQ